jgi:hypothetical protein
MKDEELNSHLQYLANHFKDIAVPDMDVLLKNNYFKK